MSKKQKNVEIEKADFTAILGYHENTALVDQRLRKDLLKKSLQSLLKDSQYKAAFCRTFFSDFSENGDVLLKHYNEISGSSYTQRNLEKLFGVFSVPTDIKKIKRI